MSVNALEVKTEAVYQGPSPYALDPVVVVQLRLPESTAQITLGCLSLGLQHLQQHWPLVKSREVVADTPELVDLARVLVQCAKAALNASRGFVQEAGVQELAPNRVRVWLGYHDWRLSVKAWRWALEAAMALGQAPHGARAAKVAREDLLKATRQAHPDYQIRFVMQAARDKGLPVLPVVREHRVWQVGWGARRKTFFESATHADSMIGSNLARNKVAGKAFLVSIGAPVAPHTLVDKETQLPMAAQHIGWPCVVKPLNRGGGKGVTANVRSMNALHAAFAYAMGFTDGPVMVERHVEGKDHRLLVISGQLVSAVGRSASVVVGDGRSTVRALIDGLNASRRQQQLGNQHWVPVVEDEVFARHLATQGVEVLDILPVGQTLTLRSVSNVSMGGCLDYVSDHVHPSVRAMAESIARASGLNTIGLDYITTDIRRDWHEMPGAFVEFNATPGLDGLDQHPGRPPEWLGDVLLGKDVGRVPVVMVLMPRAQWSAWQPTLQALSAALDVGACGPQWVWANGMAWRAENLNAHHAASAMLRHPTVERAVVVGVFEELSRWGLPLQGVQQIYWVGAGLAEPWLAVAKKVADSVEALPGLDDLTKRLEMQLARQTMQQQADKMGAQW